MPTSSAIVDSKHKQRMSSMRALAELSRQHHRRMEEGPVLVAEDHPILGRSYQRLNSNALQEYLRDATIMDKDGRFTSFSLVFGTYGLGNKPFVCVKNHLEDGLHLLIGGGE